jgi:drug/metabolite transporter (DMT)-like permease
VSAPVSQREARTPAAARLATVIAMLLATISVTVGDLLMSQAMRTLGPLRLPALQAWWEGAQPLGQTVGELPAQIYALLWLIFASAKVWMAIACMLTFLVLWMISLSWADMSFVMPLTALTYVLNAILVGPVLGEHVSSIRWVGTVLIAIGVALVTLEGSPLEEN